MDLEVCIFSQFSGDVLAVDLVPGTHYVEETLENRTGETEAGGNLKFPDPSNAPLH